MNESKSGELPEEAATNNADEPRMLMTYLHLLPGCGSLSAKTVHFLGVTENPLPYGGGIWKNRLPHLSKKLGTYMSSATTE